MMGILNRNFGFLFFIVSLTVLIFYSEAQAEIINIPADFETIQAGIDAAEDRDTILVQPGEYNENLMLENTNVTLASLFLTMGDTAYVDSTIIDGSRRGLVVIITRCNPIICGFTIQNGSGNRGGAGIRIDISNSRLVNLKVINNVNPNDGGDAGYGGGIHVSGGSNPRIENTLIANNTVEHGFGGGIFCAWGSGAILENVTISNNIAETAGSGIYCMHGGRATLLNSIITDQICLEFDRRYDPNSVRVNYSNISGGIVNQENENQFNHNSIDIGDGVISSNPLFVSPENGDYHLSHDSPCIDTGDPESPLNPDGTRADMGAFYFHQSLLDHVLEVPIEYQTIQRAIDASIDGDTVLVHSGTYVENINFEGKNITVASLYLTTGDTAYVDSTVIDGDGDGSVVIFDNNETENARLSGFSITNGSGERMYNPLGGGGGVAQVGGGILISEASPLIEHCKIYNNIAFGDDIHVDYYGLGGGIYCRSSSSIIQYCIIEENTASNRHNSGLGGGMMYVGGQIVVRNCTISRNSSEGIRGFNGFHPEIYDCIISDNTRSGMLFSGSANINNCIVSGNNQYGISVGGANSVVNIQNTEIIDNEHEAITCTGIAELNVTNCKILGVRRSVVGGAVYLDRIENARISNCQITGNEAIGIVLYLCRPVISSCTISNNSGGIFVQSRSHPIINSSIIFGNGGIRFSEEGGSVEMGVSVSYSDIQAGENGSNFPDNVEVNWLEGNIDADPLFVDPENGDFHLTGDSPCIDAGDPESPLDPDSTRADMGAFYCHYSSVFSYSEGWNLISINITPTEEYWQPNELGGPDIQLMLAGQPVSVMRDDVNRFWLPRYDYNDIPFWDLSAGYRIKMDAESNFRLWGTKLDPDADIPITADWNFIPYYPDYLLDASAPDYYVLSSIIDEVIIAKDEDGNILFPGENYSDMPPWQAGKAYQIKVARDVILNYPPPREEMGYANSSVTEERQQSHYVVLKTDNNMSVIITNMSGIETRISDQLAAYNQDGRVVGTGYINAKGQCGIAVWGDDPTTETIDGAIAGETFELRFWDSANEVELETEVIRFKEGDALKYTTDGILVLELGIRTPIVEEFYLAEAFPNPFNAITKISFSLPVQTEVSVQIFDVSGRLIETLVNDFHPAGQHSITWHSWNSSSGVYLVRMETQRFKDVRKVVLVRGVI